MIDVRKLRQDPEPFRKALRMRGEEASLVDEALRYDILWRDQLKKVNDLRAKRNAIAKEIGKLKKEGKDVSSFLEKMHELGEQLEEMERKLREYEHKREELLRALPNLLSPDVPFGTSEEDNKAVRYWGRPRVWVKFKSYFQKRYGIECEYTEKEPKSHVDILLEKGLADFKRASKIAGARFYFLKGKLVLLDFALQLFAIQEMMKRGFELLYPPFMIRRDILDGVIDLGTFEDMIYKIDGEDLQLIGTAEHPLIGMFNNEILDKLPLKLVGVSTCFRKEAGAHGKDTKGIFRVHQFNKVEQIVFCEPEESEKWHEEMRKNAERIFELLGIPYRTVLCCSAETGIKAYKAYDIEAWMPAQGKYREAASIFNCTDWQSRRSKIRYRKGSEHIYPHILDGTAIATTRAAVAIVENFYEDGIIRVPKPLQKWVGKEI